MIHEVRDCILIYLVFLVNLWLTVLPPLLPVILIVNISAPLGSTLAWLQISKAIVSAENFPATSVTKGRRGMTPALMVYTIPAVHTGLDIVPGYALVTGKIAIYVRTIKRAGPSMLDVAHKWHGTPLHKRVPTMRAANLIALHHIHEQTTLRKPQRLSFVTVVCILAINRWLAVPNFNEAS